MAEQGVWPGRLAARTAVAPPPPRLLMLLRLLDLIVSRDRLITKHGGGSCR